MKLYGKIKGSDQLDAFLPFLKDENGSVRLWAAIFLLQQHTSVAIDAIKSVIAMPGIISITAKMTLDLWEKGLLNLL